MMITDDDARRQFFCPIVDCRYFAEKHFAELRLLKQHYHKVHMPKSLSCAYCDEVKFSLRRDLVYHEKRCPRRRSQTPVATSSADISSTDSIVHKRPIANILRRSAATSTKSMKIEKSPSRPTFICKLLIQSSSIVPRESSITKPRKIAPKTIEKRSIAIQCSILARTIDTQTIDDRFVPVESDEMMSPQFFDVSSQAGCSTNTLPQDFFSQTEPPPLIGNANTMVVHSGTQMADDDLDDIFRIVQQTQTDDHHHFSGIDRPIIDRITQTDFDLMRYLNDAVDTGLMNNVDDAFLNI